MSDLKVLVFGGAGMLGHKLVQVLPAHGFDVWATVRGSSEQIVRPGLTVPEKVIEGVDVGNTSDIDRAITEARPDLVINCVGVIKQKKEAGDAADTILINSVFPHRLYESCLAASIRVITIGTDCVFSGTKGSYSESDVPDAADLYGKSKALGELSGSGALTLRTSIIGRELFGTHGLLEWFLSNSGGTVKGFTRAIFSGLTTTELGRVIGEVAIPREDLEGIYHVASAPISKFDLLGMVNEQFGCGITIESDTEFTIDRSLDGRRFNQATGYETPAWEEMIREISEDPSPYEEWRK